MIRRLFLLLLSLLLLSACRPTAPSQPTALARTPTPVPASAEEAIRQILRAESEGVVRQDMTLLAELWAEDATVTDAKHTPDVTDDDAVWHGIDAILDRYVVLVFPGNPQFAEPADVEIVVEGDQATARSTTQIGDEVSPGGDLWSFSRCNGRWCIQALTYNLETSP